MQAAAAAAAADAADAADAASKAPPVAVLCPTCGGDRWKVDGLLKGLRARRNTFANRTSAARPVLRDVLEPADAVPSQHTVPDAVWHKAKRGEDYQKNAHMRLAAPDAAVRTLISSYRRSPQMSVVCFLFRFAVAWSRRLAHVTRAFDFWDLGVRVYPALRGYARGSRGFLADQRWT